MTTYHYSYTSNWYYDQTLTQALLNNAIDDATNDHSQHHYSLNYGGLSAYEGERHTPNPDHDSGSFDSDEPVESWTLTSTYDNYCNFTAVNGVNFATARESAIAAGLGSNFIPNAVSLIGSGTQASVVTFWKGGAANAEGSNTTLANLTFTSGGTVEIGGGFIENNDKTIYVGGQSLNGLTAEEDLDIVVLYPTSLDAATHSVTATNVTVSRNLRQLVVAAVDRFNDYGMEGPGFTGEGVVASNVTVHGALEYVYVGNGALVNGLTVGDWKSWGDGEASAFMYVDSYGSTSHFSATQMTIYSGGTAANVNLGYGGVVIVSGLSDRVTSQYNSGKSKWEYTTHYASGTGGVVSGLQIATSGGISFTGPGAAEHNARLWATGNTNSFYLGHRLSNLVYTSNGAPQSAYVTFGSNTRGNDIQIGNGGSMTVSARAEVNNVSMGALTTSTTVSGTETWIGDRGAVLTINGGHVSSAVVEAAHVTSQYWFATHDEWYSHSSSYSSAHPSAGQAAISAAYSTYMSSAYNSAVNSGYQRYVGGVVNVGGGGTIEKVSRFASMSVQGGNDDLFISHVVSASGLESAVVTVAGGAHLFDVATPGGKVVMTGGQYNRQPGQENPQKNFNLIENLDLRTSGVGLVGDDHAAVVQFAGNNWVYYDSGVMDPGEIQLLSATSGLTVSGTYGHFTFTGAGTTVLDLGTVWNPTYSRHTSAYNWKGSHLTEKTEYEFGVVKGRYQFLGDDDVWTKTADLILDGSNGAAGGFDWTGTLAVGSGAVIQHVGKATGYDGGLYTANTVSVTSDNISGTTWNPVVEEDVSKMLVVVAGGSADDVKVVSAVNNYEVISNTLWRGIAGLVVSSGGTATNVTVTNGGVAMAAGGTINGATVGDGGRILMSGWGGAWQVSGNNGIAGPQYHDETTLNAIHFLSGGSIGGITETGFGGKAPNIYANADGGELRGVTFLNGVAWASGLDFAGYMTLTQDQIGSNLTVRAHREVTSVDSEGNPTAWTTYGAGLTVSSGATATSTTAVGGGVIYASAGAIVSNTILSSGGMMDFQNSGTMDIDGVTVSAGGSFCVGNAFSLTATNVAIKHGAGMQFNVVSKANANYAAHSLSGTWAADWADGAHAFNLTGGVLNGFGGQFGTLDSDGYVTGNLRMTVAYGGTVTGADLRATVGSSKYPNSYIGVNNGGKIVNTHLEGIRLTVGASGYASGLSTTLPAGVDWSPFATEIDVGGATARADDITISGGFMGVYGSAVVRNTVLFTPEGYDSEGADPDSWPPTAMEVMEGGIASNTTAHGGTITLYGAEGKYVKGGTLSRVTVDSGAMVEVHGTGGVMTGALNLGGKVVTNVYGYTGKVTATNLTVNFDLRQHDEATSAMIDNLANLTGATLSYITVKPDQANTVYVLAGGAAAFTGSISVRCIDGNTTRQLGSVKVGGTLTTTNYGKYTLAKVNNLLKLTITNNPNGGAFQNAPATPAPNVVCDDPATPNRRSVRLTANYDEATLTKQWSSDNKTWKTYTGELEITANGTYYFRSLDGFGNVSEVTSFQVTNILTTSWSQGKTTIAKDGVFTADVCMTVASMYKLTGSFGTMNGTVRLVKLDGEGNAVEGSEVAGTITKGALRFNADEWTANRRAMFDGESLYRLTIANTTGAAVTIASMSLAGVADATDDTYDGAGVKTLTLKANTATPQTMLASGWVGYGDDVDFSKFTVGAGGANLVLGLSATDDTTFYLYTAEDLAAGNDAPEDAIQTLAVTAAEGTKRLDCGQLAAGTYYLKAVTQSDPEPEDPEAAPTYRDAEYTVKALSCLQVQDGENSWALAANQTLNKGASKTYGLRLAKGSMYAFTSQKIGNLTGTVTLTNAAGAVVATGTVAAGKVTFNGGKRVRLDEDAVYGLTFKNTGTAAANLALTLANPANNADDAYDGEGVATVALTKASQVVASNWVGYGDAADFTKFTVAAPTLVGMTLTATAATTFALYAEDDLENALQTVNVAANGTGAFASREFVNGTTYYVKATTAANDSTYTVKTNAFIIIIDQANTLNLGQTAIAKGGSYTFAARFTKQSMYALSGSFGTLTGKVTLKDQAGATVASGTVTNGKLVFNNGRRVQIAADAVYLMTITNTGKAAATMASLRFAAAAGNGDDDATHAAVLQPTKPGQTLAANWVGLGDATDYATFTLDNPTIMGLTFTATAATTFTLYRQRLDGANNPLFEAEAPVLDEVQVFEVAAGGTARLNTEELAAGPYFLKATTAANDCDYTVKTSDFIIIIPGEREADVGQTAIAKGGSYTFGARFEKASMYALSGAFGTLTGTVTMTNAAGQTLATGTVTNGKLVFNGGRRVQVDADATYFLTFKNTGTAAATIGSMKLAAAAGNADDEKANAVEREVSRANQVVVSDWVGLGDMTDYSTFTLEDPTTLSLTVTATGKTRFALYTEDDVLCGGVNVMANGNAISATIDAGELEAGNYYLVVDSLNANGGDSSYTVKTSAFVVTEEYDRHWSCDATNIAKGGTFSVGLRMALPSYYDFTGSDFGTLTGTVKLTQGGITIATGTVTNGKLVFNDGQRVALAADTTYVLSVTNTGKAATVVPTIAFGAAADDTDDDPGHIRARGTVTKAGQTIVSDWVGLGDGSDFSAFALAGPATLSLTVTATGDTEFLLCDDGGAEINRVTVMANGNLVSANLFNDQLEAGEYHLVVNALNDGDCDYTVKAASFVATSDRTNSWTQGQMTLAKGGSFTVGLRMTKQSRYALSGSFGTLTGTVTLTHDGVTMASGTITNGKLTFNGGKRVTILDGETYILTVKNTGKAAATIANMNFAAAADNSDDDTEHAKDRGAVTKAGQTIASDWVGLGDLEDYSMFTLANRATISLTVTATDYTEFEFGDFVNDEWRSLAEIEVRASGKALTATLVNDEFNAGTYYVRATSVAGGDSAYTLKASSFVVTQEFADSWSQGKTTLAKGGSISVGMRMTKASMYALSGSFGTLTGTVTLTQDGVTMATGTITNGKLTFNGGQRVEVADGATYVLTVKNTGAAAATITSMKFAAAANVTDDTFETAKARGTVTKAGQAIATDWVGIGDAEDYSKFTLANSASLGLTVSAKNNTTFTFLDKDQNVLGTATVIANGTTVSANIAAQNLVAGTYYVHAESLVADDADYTVKASATSKIYASNNANDTLNAAKGLSASLNTRAVNSKKAIVGQAVTGWVGFGDAADFIKVAVAQAGKVSLAMNAATAAGRTAGKLNVKLYNANGTELALAAVNGTTLKTSQKLAKGTYYLGVSTSPDAGPTQYNNSYQVTAKWLAS